MFSCPWAWGQTASPPPYPPSLDRTSIDKTVDACADFYHYACGGWQKRNPIPPDEVSWGVTSKMFEENFHFLRGILEGAAAARKQGKVTQKIGDFYAASMNEPSINRRGVVAIQPRLKAISEVKNQQDLAPLVARLQLEFPGNHIRL